jgi:Tol biopolymer transport system component
MSELRELLDREAQRIDADPDALESMFRLRDRRRRDRRVGAAFVGLAVFAVVVALFALTIWEQRSVPATPTPTPTPSPSVRNGDIAVRANIGEGRGAIILVDPITGHEVTLPVEGVISDVWWSPDGRTLAYLRKGWDLWVLDVASGESRKIVPACACDLAWSPDGTAIAIISNYPYLEVMNSDGSGRTRILEFGSEPGRPPGNAHDPAWTRDGERILFAVETSGGEPAPAEGGSRRSLYMIDRSGSGLTLLDEFTYAARQCCLPIAWSPDGSKVAYFTFSTNGSYLVGVAVAGTDGSNPTVVLDRTITCCPGPPSLAWSPDGTQLALVIDPLTPAIDPGPQGLYVMNADGTGLRLLREGATGRPGWRPVP